MGVSVLVLLVLGVLLLFALGVLVFGVLALGGRGSENDDSRSGRG